MTFNIKLTWSKLVALIILFAAVFLDIQQQTLQAFMYALPFITFLITGKMLSDYGQQKLKSNQ